MRLFIESPFTTHYLYCFVKDLIQRVQSSLLTFLPFS